MEEPILKLRSSIKPALKKSVLLRGTLLGISGLALWLYGGIYLPINVLTVWGWPILILGGVLIIFGLVPYRKLTRVENKPNELILTDLEELNIYVEGIPFLKVDFENIEEMAYLDDEKRYGIGLWIKNPKTKHIIILHPLLDLNLYLKNTQKRYFCDIFLPYFSKRSFQELEEAYKAK